MYKLIFVDIDGTLCNDERKVTARTVESVRKAVEKGYVIVLCSGRDREYVVKKSKDAGASPIIINSTGGEIFDYYKQKVLFSNYMDVNACRCLFELAKAKDVSFVMFAGGKRYANKLFANEIIIDDFDTFEFKNQITQGLIVDRVFKKVRPLEADIIAIDNVKIGNRSKVFSTLKTEGETYFYYDVISPRVSKGIAIKALCSLFNEDVADTIGIGNDRNDLEMFNTVGLSVAVGNALDEIKNNVKQVIGSNNNNGVAEFLDSLL